jgi:hypothetical protein
MIDSLHLEARTKIIPSPCLVGVDDAPSGDAPANDGDGLSLMLHDWVTVGHPAGASPRHSRACVLVFAPSAINSSDSMIFRPDMAAKPTAIDFNDPC